MGKYVVHSERYSAETRGGDACSELVLADDEGEVGFIKVVSADLAAFLYRDQALKYSDKVGRDALVIVDEELVPEFGLPLFRQMRHHKAHTGCRTSD